MSATNWHAQEPPVDFVDRVMARIHEGGEAFEEREVVTAPAPKLDARVAAGLVLAAAAALFAAGGFSGSGASERGDAVAAVRHEVHVGRRGIAVLEPGAHVSWDGDEVTQTAGEVFYRIEGRASGRAFRVHTSEGDVEVLGTCFRVRVENAEVRMKRREVKIGALGAVVGAAVLVSVYEGKVLLSRAGAQMSLAAGESARASPRGVARDAASEGDTANGAGDPLVAANANLADAVREYKRRLDAIEAQKASTEKQLEDAKQKLALAAGGGQVAPYRSEYDLSQDDWKELAKKGQARARFPCPDAASWKASPKVVSALGLSPDDTKRIREAAEQSAERIWAAVRPICVEALEGNARMADKLGPRNCQTLVLDTAEQHNEDVDEEIRKVAEIRAGMIPMPADPKVLGSYGRMIYTLTGESRAMEQKLAQSFGPDTAHRLVFGEEAELCSLDFDGGPRPTRRRDE